MHEIDFLTEQLTESWKISQKGGFTSILYRWHSSPWKLIQKLGINKWIKTRLFFGEKMWIHTGETVSSSLLSFGYSELALSALMIEVIKPGMKIIDVGSHLGYESLLACQLVGDKGCVISFEPNPVIAYWTEKNLHKYNQSIIHKLAVGEENETKSLPPIDILDSAFGAINKDNQENLDNDEPGIHVKQVTLDDAINRKERPVDFIKVDVEGAELSVLSGAKKLIKEDWPLIILESDMSENQSDNKRIKEYIHFLDPFGYLPFSFEYDGALQITALGHIKVGHANVGFMPVNNVKFNHLLDS